MFGFGMPKEHKLLIQQIANTLTALGDSAGEVQEHAKILFNKAKREAETVFGAHVESNSLGDVLLSSNVEFREKRISAGLTVQEIKMHWNRTPIMQCIEEQLRQAMVIIYIGTQTQQGVSEVEAYDKYRKLNPIYGDPEKFVQPTLPDNVVWSPADAPLYPEFSTRVERWRGLMSGEIIQVMMKKSTSLNALFRDTIKLN